MGLLAKETSWDWSIHNVDGTHRQTAPTTESQPQEKWKARLDRHVAAHIAEAKRANEPLRVSNDLELADLADRASEATQGAVHYAYTTIPDKKYYYVFNGIDGRWSRTEIARELHLTINRMSGL